MKRILSIKTVHVVDESPDTSFLGKYTDEWGEFHFDREQGKMLKTLERDRSYEMSARGREGGSLVNTRGTECQQYPVND